MKNVIIKIKNNKNQPSSAKKRNNEDIEIYIFERAISTIPQEEYVKRLTGGNKMKTTNLKEDETKNRFEALADNI